MYNNKSDIKIGQFYDQRPQSSSKYTDRMGYLDSPSFSLKNLLNGI